MLGDAAAPETTPSRITPSHGMALLSGLTEDDWAKKTFGTLVDQLYKRPAFREALGIRHSKDNLGKILRRHTRANLAQLIMMLDATR